MGLTRTELYDDHHLAQANVLKAVGHPARLAILEHLLQHCTCINSGFIQLTGLSQASVSRHLAVLEEAGLVSSQKGAYCIDPEGWKILSEQFVPLVARARQTSNSCNT